SEADVQQRLQELQAEFQQLNAEIESVQRQASDDPKASDALEAYRVELTKQMKEIEPDKAELIDERDELYNQLMALSENTDPSEEETQKLQTLGQRFNEVRQELSVVETQANQSGPVQEAFNAYNDAIMAAMNEVDSNIDQKIKQREELTEEFSTLRNAIQQQQ
ncbi:MAG: hypothetical protein ACLFS1_09435, partial [Opitutales bacterium]